MYIIFSLCWTYHASRLSVAEIVIERSPPLLSTPLCMMPRRCCSESTGEPPAGMISPLISISQKQAMVCLPWLLLTNTSSSWLHHTSRCNIFIGRPHSCILFYGEHTCTHSPTVRLYCLFPCFYEFYFWFGMYSGPFAVHDSCSSFSRTKCAFPATQASAECNARDAFVWKYARA